MIKGFLDRYNQDKNALALTIGDVSLTYESLLTKAQQIRSAIQDTRSHLIGVYTDNNEYTYAAMLGVILAGKGFVPLNSKFPEERLQAIIEQVELKDIIACDESMEEVRKLADDLNIIQANTKTVISGELTDRIIPHMNSTAYVLFTSGSTGKPKGIPISYANFDCLLESSANRWEILSSDKVLQTFELSFDISLGVTFMCWDKGAHLVVTSFNGITAINAYQSMRDHDVSFAVLPPSSISYMKKFRLLDDIKLPEVRCTLFIGEVLLHQHVIDWNSAAYNSKVINTYGPTEATVWCFAYDLTDQSVSEVLNGGCPIGLPMQGTGYHIDYSKGHKEKEGELCLSGAQVFEGYIKNPTKTNEVFFQNSEGIKYYRTGDIVVENEKGNLVFVNRVDSQVKINGFRVELGEIEHVIREIMGTFNVITYVVDIMGTATIKAVVEAHEIDENDLKSQLSERLPQYMIPKNITALDEFPLNNSGKIDRIKIKSLVENGS